MDDAMYVHMVLSLGHVGLLLRVCARRDDTGPVKADVGCIDVRCSAPEPL